MAEKIFIFDFDGVIADSFHIVMSLLNDLADEYGFRKIESEKFHELRDFSSEELYLEKLEIPMMKLPFIIMRARKELERVILDMKPFANMSETLSELNKKGVMLGILTTNSRDNVRLFLKKNNINSFAFAQSGSLVPTKYRDIKKTIERYRLDKNCVYYIGDETRDIEASKKLGIKSIAVTWGYNSREILEKYEPDYIINKPEELLNIN